MKKRLRRGFSIDRVAMAGLPLIILIFLVMVMRPKNWYNSSVDLPEATMTRIIDWDGDFATIILKKGKCSLVIDSGLRALSLKDMGKKYNIIFSPQQVTKFSQIVIFGSPMKTLPIFINTHSSPFPIFDSQSGIPIDSATNELSDWIKIASKHNNQVNSRKLQIELLCDKNEPYTNIKLIRDALRKDSIFRVAMVYFPKPLKR